MQINSISGEFPAELNKKTEQKDGDVTLNSVFDAESDGGEELTEKEYNELSSEDKEIVDGWRNLIEKFIGKGAKITRINLWKALVQKEMEITKEREQEMMDKIEKDLEKERAKLKIELSIDKFARDNNISFEEAKEILQKVIDKKRQEKPLGEYETLLKEIKDEMMQEIYFDNTNKK